MTLDSALSESVGSRLLDRLVRAVRIGVQPQLVYAVPPKPHHALVQAACLACIASQFFVGQGVEAEWRLSILQQALRNHDRLQLAYSIPARWSPNQEEPLGPGFLVEVDPTGLDQPVHYATEQSGRLIIAVHSECAGWKRQSLTPALRYGQANVGASPQ